MTTSNELVVGPMDVTSPFAGLQVIESGYDLAQAIQSGDWVSGTLAGVATALDAAVLMTNPLGALIEMGAGWVLDHVEPLKTWFNDLTGDAGEVAGFAQTWENVSAQLAETADELRYQLRQVEELSGEAMRAYRVVHGDAADHVALVAEWAHAMSAGMQAASMIVQVVHDLVRDALAMIVSVVIEAAAAAAVTLGLAAPFVGAHVAEMVASEAIRVGRSVDDLVASVGRLQGLLDRLRGLMDQVGDVFSSAMRGGSRRAPSSSTPPPRRSASAAPVSPGGRRRKDGEGEHREGRAMMTEEERLASRPKYTNPAHAEGISPYWDDKPGHHRVSDSGLRYMQNPGARYGVDEDGVPLSREQWENEYLVRKPDGSVGPEYPPHNGFVPETITTHMSLDDYFAAGHDRSLGRTGHPGGQFLAETPGGTPVAPELLAFDPRKFREPVYAYQLVRLPEGYTIQTGVVAPAFGFPGGGQQVLIFDREGDMMSVIELVEAGVLK